MYMIPNCILINQQRNTQHTPKSAKSRSHKNPCLFTMKRQMIYELFKLMAQVTPIC